jgi:cytochrome c peroxidase
LYFDDDPDLPDMECAHCHNIPLATSDEFFNNGLTFTGESLDAFPDLGRGKVTGSKADNGKFKATTLRNIKYTAPYMHDGRFKTLDEVLDFYATGGQKSPNKDKNLHKLQMTPFYREALLAFIETFNDTTFNNKKELQSPFK